MFLYPWGDMHSLNLGWFLLQFKDWVEKIQEYLDNGGGTSENLANVIAPVFNAANSYSSGDYVLYNDELYKATRNVQPGTWNPDDWSRTLIVDEMGSGGGAAIDNVARLMIAGQYSASYGYQKYAICRYNDKLWMANTDLPSIGEAWNPAHWDEITVGAGLTGLRRTVDTLTDAIAGIGNVHITNGAAIYDNLNTIHIHPPTNSGHAQFTIEPDGIISARTSNDGGATWSNWSIIAYRNVNRRTHCNLVCFGDSWVNGTGIPASDRPTKRFTAIVAKQLNMQEFEFADGGERFVGGYIQNEINTAQSSMTGNQRNNTGVVLIVGGLNDYRHKFDTAQFPSDPMATATKADFAEAVKNCAIRAHEVFPNALIVLGIGNTNLSYFPQGAKEWYQYAIRVCETDLDFPHICIKNLYNVISGISTYYDSDNIHPSEAGHKMFGGYIADAILGGGQNVDYYITDITLETGFTWDTTGGVQLPAKLYRINDEFVLTPGAMIFPSSTDSLTKFSALPREMTPSQNMYAPIYRSNVPVGGVTCVESGNMYVKPGSSIPSCFTSQLRWFFGKELNNDES